MTNPDPLREALTFDEAIANVRTAYRMWESEFVVGPQERAAHERELNATLAALAQPEPLDVLTNALWQCGVESGMDTDGDAGPGAVIAGMGVERFAAAMVDGVKRLRESYDEWLSEADPT